MEQKLLQAAKDFLEMYERTFGEPEECEEYFNLKKIIAKYDKAND